jgi:hypothetical protein
MLHVLSGLWQVNRSVVTVDMRPLAIIARELAEIRCALDAPGHPGV